MIVPTYYRSEPTVFFGAIPNGHIQTHDHRVVYTMQADREQKISVRAMATTGRVGYLYAQDDGMALVIRNFAVRPSGNYVDERMWDGLAQQPNDAPMAKTRCLLGNPSSLHVASGRSSCLSSSRLHASHCKNPTVATRKLDGLPIGGMSFELIGWLPIGQSIPHALRVALSLLMTGWIYSLCHRYITDLIVSSNSVDNFHFTATFGAFEVR